MDANQYRREYKFVLPPPLGEVIRGRVGKVMSDGCVAVAVYPVFTEYFDTSDRTSYWQKQFGIPNRSRLRSRIYGAPHGEIPMNAFVEVKHKLDGVTVKRRLAVDLDELEQLSEGIIPLLHANATPADELVLAEIVDLVSGCGCRPVVQLHYRRIAYDSGPEGTIRITFDNDPCCRFRRVPLAAGDSDFELPLLEPGSSIMEVKTIGAVPYWLRNLIGEFNLIPISFSKYATALEIYELKCHPPVSPSAPARAIPRNQRQERIDGQPATTVRRPSHPSPAPPIGTYQTLFARLVSRFHHPLAR